VIALSRYDRERRAVAGLIEDVRAGKRSLPDLTRPEREALRGLPLVEFLIEQSRALRHRDPVQMIDYAELACNVAERLDDEPYGPAFLADWRARTWAELGNAYRIADDLKAAEEALGRAGSWWERGTGDKELLARLGDLMGSFLSDAGRFPEGIKILQAVQGAYRHLGDRHLAGRAMLSEGMLIGYDGDPEGALLRLSEAIPLIDLRREPALALSAVQGIVLFLVDSGRFRRARAVLSQHRWLYQKNGDRLNLLRLRWNEGKIYAGLGQARQAEEALEETRHGFQEEGQVYDAALAGLDLALLWQGQRTRIAGLVGELIGTFKSYRIAREAIAVLLIVRECCASPTTPNEALREQIGTAIALVHELERRHPRRARRRLRR
jgi:tetratricopeptide (TPR) repeat protein